MGICRGHGGGGGGGGGGRILTVRQSECLHVCTSEGSSQRQDVYTLCCS